MRTRVKAFVAESAAKLEVKMNEWLDGNPNIAASHVQLSAVSDPDQNFVYALIVYLEPRK